MPLTRLQYIDKYKSLVIAATEGTTLFPSVMMAQALIESADRNGIPGNSSLARNYNAHFGIKADKRWKGKTTAPLNTPKDVALGGPAVSVFRAYGSAAEGFKDRVAFLHQNSNYTRAGVFTAVTPDEQALALQTAGYAGYGNQEYAGMIISVMRKYKLYELDKKKVK